MPKHAEAKDLSPKQTAFIEVLLMGNTIKAAGQEAGVSVRTASVWIRLPQVRDELKRLQDESLGRALRMISTVAPKAIRTLDRNMGQDRPDNIQVQAARALLAQIVPLSQFVDLEERLKAL